ncbi:MAG: ABC transporter substrate-binding protein [Oligoflexia bacterium]|nr:ABC transporter substrate-binding protein [Oligoflexia bacterium]
MKKQALLISLALVLVAVVVINFIVKSGKGSENTVMFWHGIEGREKNEVLQRLIDEYNKKTGDVKIVAENYGAADQLSGKIMAAVSGNTAPDILWWAPQQFGELARSGLLLSLDGVIENDSGFDKSDIYSGLWDASTIDGKIYSLPFDTNSLAVYYNKKMFREAGVSVPKTWLEFQTVAAKLTRDSDSDGIPEVYGFMVPLGKNEWTVWTWQCFLWQAGGEFYDPKTNRVSFAGGAGTRALNYWLGLLDKKHAIFSENNAGYKLTEFLSGRVAMVINGPWNFQALKDQDKIDVGSFMLPKNRVRATNIGGENIAFFKKSEKKLPQLWAFAKYVMGEEFQVKWAISTGYLPVSKKAAASGDYQEFLEQNPFIRVYVDSMSIGRVRPSIPEYNKMSAILGEYLEKALYKKLPAGEALDDAQKKISKIL